MIKFVRYFIFICILSFGLLQLASFADGDFGFGIEHENIKARKDIKIGGVDEDQKENILDVVKNFINRTLGILALIALILVLYGGLLMVIAAGDDEKYKKGWIILKTASLGIIFIGLARFILSLIFRGINTFSKDAGSANSLE